MPFFAPNEKSNCVFQVNEWCDHFHHGSPTAALEFFCSVEPYTVRVLLPEGGPRAADWDAIYGVIASVWQDRTAGFTCERISYSDIMRPKPCDACRAARSAQIVVMEVDLGGELEQPFRDMTLASKSHLSLFAMHPAFGRDVPAKKLILIGNGKRRGSHHTY